MVFKNLYSKISWTRIFESAMLTFCMIIPVNIDVNLYLLQAVCKYANL